MGQSEEQREPTAYRLRLTASVVRNVLLLPANGEGRMATGGLLDAAGRKVLDLRLGANYIGGLAPGVYFVREEPQGTSVKPQAVQKVVITQ